ncbi:MAG: VOC family protein [Proteobacteria bacterium]|nr:VOC family protein [Pseudomonadota bacterium]
MTISRPKPPTAGIAPTPQPTEDVGFTHVALPCSDIDASIAFYRRYADMEVVHRREDDGVGVVWLSDRTRPFVIVLMQVSRVDPRLTGFAHLGVACRDRDEVDRRCALAREEGCLADGPHDWGDPVGYWAFVRDPDGHNLELSHGQRVGVAVAATRP